MSELFLPGEVLPLTPERRERAIGERLKRLASLLPTPYAQGLVQPVADQLGYQELLAPASPAAGASFRYRVPGDEVLRPLAVLCRLTTDATVGLRSLTLELRDAEDVRYLVAGTQAQLAASMSQGFCWHPLAGDVAWPVDDVAIAPLPQLFVYPTHSLVLKVGNVQAGDQLDLIRLSVEKFQTGQT